MLKHLISLSFALILAMAPAKADETPAAPTEAALTFVGAFSDAHLAGMLQRIGARQPVLVAASQIDGNMLAAVFDAEVAQAVKVHGPAWQRNMALAWTPLLTDDEMMSLATAGAQSPHTDKYIELSSTAGQTMQSLSEELFRSILSEVLEKTVTQLGATQ